MISDKTHEYLATPEGQTLLKEATKKAASVNAVKNDIVKYIKEKRLINFRYDSPVDPNNQGYYRNIEPYVLGVSKAGNLVLRAWQTNMSSSASMDSPNWRMFRLDGISQIIPVNQKFDTDEATLKRIRPGYNAEDRDMVKIIISILPITPQRQSIKRGAGINKPAIKGLPNQKTFFKQKVDDLKKKTTSKKKETPKSVFSRQTDKMKIPVQKAKPKVNRGWMKSEIDNFVQKQKAKKKKKK